MNAKIENFKIYIYVILLVILEQITKIIIIKNLSRMPIIIIKNVLRFTYCENKGVAFSIGDGNVPIFIVLNVIIICVLIVFYEKNKGNFNKLAKLFFVMVISGGGSNLIDRIFRGYVIDFIDINEIFNFAIFNVADMLIVIGICGLGISFLMQRTDNNISINKSKKSLKNIIKE